MPTSAKSDLRIVDDKQEARNVIIDAAKQTAPMVQRLASHRDRVDLAVKELESERFEILSRRDHLRRQTEAVESGFAMHLEDIEATLKMYETGVNHSVGTSQAVQAPPELRKAKPATATTPTPVAGEEQVAPLSSDIPWLDRLVNQDASASRK